MPFLHSKKVSLQNTPDAIASQCSFRE